MGAIAQGRSETAALDAFGISGLAEGISGQELITGRELGSDEHSDKLGQGLGNAITAIVPEMKMMSTGS